jgi:hypothetical protein
MAMLRWSIGAVGAGSVPSGEEERRHVRNFVWQFGTEKGKCRFREKNEVVLPIQSLEVWAPSKARTEYFLQLPSAMPCKKWCC